MAARQQAHMPVDQLAENVHADVPAAELRPQHKARRPSSVSSHSCCEQQPAISWFLIEIDL